MKILVSINKVNYKSDINTTLSYTLSIIEKANDLINLSSVCYLTLVVRLSAEKYLCFGDLKQIQDTKSKTPQQAVSYELAKIDEYLTLYERKFSR